MQQCRMHIDDLSNQSLLLRNNKWKLWKGLEVNKSTQYKVQDHNHNFKQQVL